VVTSRGLAMGSRDLIWIVDDSPLQAALLNKEVCAEYQVETFQGGAPMIERLSATAPPMAMLVDWHMPDMTGLEVCRFVRETHDAAQLPVLIVTASADRTNMLLAFDAGANDFIRTPFDPDELRARLAGILRSRRLYAELARAREELRTEAEFRERFIGILGHDLRQPLNTFLVGAHFLARQGLSEPQAKTVARLGRAAHRMSRMVSDVLDLTRTRLGGGLPITLGAGNLNDIVGAVVEEMRESHPERAIDLQVSGDGLGQWDHDRLTQLCTNLIANALEHGRWDAPVRIELDDRDEGIALSVSNAGEPLPPETLRTLFEAFRRGQTANATGLGLGLFIVRAIAEAHGGSVNATCSDGRIVFRVLLPRVPPAQQSESLASA
jgi:sigma-B regulation protein RsbU (phosphoserine phosphatase)